MRDETFKAIKMIKDAAKRYSVPFQWCDALQAVQICEDIVPSRVKIGIETVNQKKLRIYFDKDIYQKSPFVYIKDNIGNIRREEVELLHVPNCPYYLKYAFVQVKEDDVKIGVACTSNTGNKSVLVERINHVKVESDYA